jgi:hypothetical protein
MEQFRMVLEDCNLEDLGFEGAAFTWKNHHHKVEWRRLGLKHGR